MLQDFAYFVICLSLKKKQFEDVDLLQFFRLWLQPNTFSIISFDGHKSRSSTLVWENENQPIPPPRPTITQYILLVALFVLWLQNANLQYLLPNLSDLKAKKMTF